LGRLGTGVGESHRHNGVAVLGGLVKCLLQCLEDGLLLTPNQRTHLAHTSVQPARAQNSDRLTDGRSDRFLSQRVEADLSGYDLHLWLSPMAPFLGQSDVSPMVI
jgi:hypothetical protein